MVVRQGKVKYSRFLNAYIVAQHSSYAALSRFARHKRGRVANVVYDLSDTSTPLLRSHSHLYK